MSHMQVLVTNSQRAGIHEVRCNHDSDANESKRLHNRCSISVRFVTLHD